VPARRACASRPRGWPGRHPRSRPAQRLRGGREHAGLGLVVACRVAPGPTRYSPERSTTAASPNSKRPSTACRRRVPVAIRRPATISSSSSGRKRHCSTICVPSRHAQSNSPSARLKNTTKTGRTRRVTKEAKKAGSEAEGEAKETRRKRERTRAEREGAVGYPGQTDGLVSLAIFALLSLAVLRGRVSLRVIYSGIRLAPTKCSRQ